MGTAGRVRFPGVDAFGRPGGARYSAYHADEVDRAAGQ